MSKLKRRNVVSMNRNKPVNPDVVRMIDERFQAHRRGHYFPLGSISFLETFAGVLRFPTAGGAVTGPTLGYVVNPVDNKPDKQKLIVLSEWNGVPDLFEKGEQFCLACLANCHVCGAKGTKRCEALGCGGNGWVPGPFENCDGPGCMVETGKFNSDCPKCKGFGQVTPRVTCVNCKGSGEAQCSFCRGNTRYSTGIKGGATDFMLGKCEQCQGQQRAITVKPQPLQPHINALLPDPAKGPIVAIGPIFSFGVDLSEEMRVDMGTPLQLFDVKADTSGDHAFLLLDTSSSPQWPYLVGGVIGERTAGAVDNGAMSR